MSFISNVHAVKERDNQNKLGGFSTDPEPVEVPMHRLDSPAAQATFLRLQEWLLNEQRVQDSNRLQMMLDQDYYDGEQWSQDEIAALAQRNQAALVFNQIKPAVDWVLGTERRTRIDHKVLGRESSDTEIASCKSNLLKYLNDTCRGQFHRSFAFAEAVKAGLGWLECGVRNDPTEEMLYVRHESWRNMLYDSNSAERDLSDARYIFRVKWLDEDVALTYFPDRQALIRAAVKNSNQTSGDGDHDNFESWYMGVNLGDSQSDYAVGRYGTVSGSSLPWASRPRVRMVECWYRLPVRQQFIAGGEFDRMPFNPRLTEHQRAISTGGCSLFDRVTMTVRCAIFTANGLVHESPSPYGFNRFPFVPIWCYRRGRDNAPYGLIRQVRDLQDDLNKRASKAQFALSTNQIEMEEGAVNPDELEDLREEAARPDGIIIRNRGKALEVKRNSDVGAEQLQLMQQHAVTIREVSGVTPENMGRQTNADSGKAIMARQEQGSVVTTEVFDNLRFSVQQLGEMELSLIEQFYTEHKVLRVLGQRGGAKYLQLNQLQADGSVLNDITATQADFVVAEQDFRSSLRQAMFESLFDIVGRIAQVSPESALSLLDLVVEMADLPGKDELVARIRKINGQNDPDEEETPESQQEKAREQAQQQAKQALAQAQLMAELEKTKAEIERLAAEAIDKRIVAMNAALQAAEIISTNPAAGHLADVIARGAGLTDLTPESDIQTNQPTE